jgi:hypothetical protein
MNEEEQTINRLAPLNGDKPAPIKLEHGVIARHEGEVIRLMQDDAELVRFPIQACPFDSQPLNFLLQIYVIGYSRGKTVGREAMKTKLRDLLGTEI